MDLQGAQHDLAVAAFIILVVLSVGERMFFRSHRWLSYSGLAVASMIWVVFFSGVPNGFAV